MREKGMCATLRVFNVEVIVTFLSALMHVWSGRLQDTTTANVDHSTTYKDTP